MGTPPPVRAAHRTVCREVTQSKLFTFISNFNLLMFRFARVNVLIRISVLSLWNIFPADKLSPYNNVHFYRP